MIRVIFEKEKARKNERLEEIIRTAEKSDNILAWTVHAKEGKASPQEMQLLSSFLAQKGVSVDEYLGCVRLEGDHLSEVKDYWDQRSHGFSDAINEEADSHLGEDYRERFRKLFGDEPLKILDDGAGAGFFSILLASLGHKVTSIDYSDGMVGHIEENMAKRGLECEALQMDAQDLKFEDESFDAVVQRNVMWNLDHPEKAYDEIYRVQNPGGIFLIDDGNHYLAAHDEEYAEAAAKRKAEFEAMRAKEDLTPGSHYRHNPENVDFTIIEEIAKEQPMSYRRRPQWDLDQMIRLGFKEIHVEIFGKGLPGRYIVVAKKPEEI